MAEIRNYTMDSRSGPLDGNAFIHCRSDF